MKPLLTCTQVCQLLSISPATLTRWVRANKIPYVLLGTGATKLNVRFREEEIEAWLSRRSRGAVPPINRPVTLSVVNGERET